MATATFLSWQTVHTFTLILPSLKRLPLHNINSWGGGGCRGCAPPSPMRWSFLLRICFLNLFTSPSVMSYLRGAPLLRKSWIRPWKESSDNDQCDNWQVVYSKSHLWARLKSLFLFSFWFIDTLWNCYVFTYMLKQVFSKIKNVVPVK